MDTLLDTRLGMIFLLGGRLADSLSTIAFVEKLGLDAEQNPFLKFLMKEYGSVSGNVLHTVGIMAIAIPTAHALNKFCEKVGLKKLKGGNMLVYVLGGAESYSVAIQNLIFTYF